MMNTYNYKYGTLIAKLMGEKIDPQEEKELHEWMWQNEDNMKLFEDLTNDWKAKWAKNWFDQAGVKTNFIKWKKMSGWYEPEPQSLRDFYILSIAAIAVMVLMYLILRYIDRHPPP